MDGESDSEVDEEITLLFDDSGCLKSTKRVLEAASPILKTALNECEHDGTLQMPGTSKEAWELILYYIGSEDPPSDISSRIKNVSADTLVDVARQCQLHGISSIPEAIDKGIANDIATMKVDLRLFDRGPPYEYLNIDLNDRPIKFVKKIEMAKSDEALAAFLVAVITANEHIRKQRVINGMTLDIEEFDSTMGSLIRFINEMHNASRDRFCFLFARGIMTERFDTFSKEFSDILAKTLDT